MLFSFHGFSLSEFLCRNNTTNDRDVLGLFLSVFSSCLLFTEQISGARSDRTRASSCVCLSPVSPPTPVPQTRSTFLSARTTKRFPSPRCASAILTIFHPARCA